MLAPIPGAHRASHGGGLVWGVTGDSAPHTATREVSARNP